MSDVPAGITASLPAELAEAVDARVREARVTERIRERDATLWAPEGTPEVADRLGWLDSPAAMRSAAAELRSFAAGVQADGFTDVLLLGMGGSSLAPEVFRVSSAPTKEGVSSPLSQPAESPVPGLGGLRLHVLDTTEPVTIGAFADGLDLERTLVLVSTKSGGTIETKSLRELFWARHPVGNAFVAITDPGSGLAEVAAERGYRETFLNDPDIGGRYSALSYFGLVPAALAGVDLEALLRDADSDEAWAAGLWLGLALGELGLRGRDKVTFVIDPPLRSLGLWLEQLLAESLGKHGRGSLPVADEPVALAAYGNDRVFVHVGSGGSAFAESGFAAAGHPVVSLEASGVLDLGRVFFVAELATAVMGWVMEVNPFDQPDVQAAKDATARVLAEGPPSLGDGTLGELLDGLAPPAYLAIHGYLPYGAETDAAVTRLRAAVLERFGAATTFGYGPRFLHSTGQFHKGGPPVGRFLQMVSDDGADLEIPCEELTFRTLISAQADGDLQTLRDRGRPAVRVRVPAGDVAGAIDDLAAAVAQSVH